MVASRYYHGQQVDNTVGHGPLGLPAEALQTVRLEEETMRALDVAAATTLVIGGMGLGLVGLWGIDFMGTFYQGALSRVFFGLVGLSAIYRALEWRAIQKRWALAWARYE
jgi:uncharacterized membrane protein YuzA (DUF378 family)